MAKVGQAPPPPGRLSLVDCPRPVMACPPRSETESDNLLDPPWTHKHSLVALPSAAPLCRAHIVPGALLQRGRQD
eukprot:55684-Chlamydomonas_euryale.AAC.2